MRTGVLAVLASISMPILSFAQSTLNFPRVLQQGEFSSTGFALINPEPSPASVTFTLLGADGSSQATATLPIPARGQLARLGRELFPAATGSGWVQATSASSGLQGFWFSGDLATYADGAEAAASSNDVVLPLIGPDTDIHIANTGSTDATVLLNLLGTDGFLLAESYPQKIPAKGFLRANMVTLFPTLTDLSLPSHMRISCPCPNSPFAATVVSRNLLAAPSWSVSNGVPAVSSDTTIYFPYLVEGPQEGGGNWRSLVGLTNLSTTSPNNVTLTFTSDSGAIVRTNQLTLPANGGMRFFARDLFALTTGFQTGWVRVTSTSGIPFSGYIAYSDLSGGGVAVVPPQQQPLSTLLFAHIAELPPWLTGLALLNTNIDVANIEVFAMTPAGSLIGKTTFSVQPGTNTARLLRELIPQTQSRTTDGGFVFVRSSLPIYGIELFFSRNLQILGNVPAIPGTTFVPPQ